MKVSRTMHIILQAVALALYYGFARHLPVSYSPFGLSLTKPIRGTLCHFIFEECGKNVNVERGAWFAYRNHIKLGSYSGIGINARLHSSGGITIGNNVIMGREVIILSEGPEYHDPTKLMQRQPKNKDEVIIEDDVFIGLRSIILPGVRIGKSSIIGAGAVVAKDVPPYSIAAGNPARIIGNRLEKR